MKTALQNARIFDGDKVIEKGSVLFDEQGIIEVSEGTLTGDRNIDAAGKTVTPGLIDCHVHLGGRDMNPTQRAACMAYQMNMIWKYGITTVRSAADNDNIDILVRDLINKGAVKGCRIIAAGKVLSITGGGPDGYECDTVDEMRKATRQQIKCTADFIKIGATGSMGGKNSIPGVPLLTQEQMDVAVEEANRVGKLVMVHATSQGVESAKRAAKAGVRSIEHIQMDEETAKLMAENGVYYCPTIVTRYNIIHNTKPEFMYMTVKADPGDLERKKKAIQLCKKYGVPVAAGTDASVGGIVPLGETLATELGIYVEYGMTALEAMRSATRVAAEMMKIDDETGTLKTGKQADITVFDGDPTSDITDVKNVAMTFQCGELVYTKD